jgi:hypothetical protein
MNKALIEKAFEKWLEDYKSRSRCTHLDAFTSGATWQREQLEAEIKEAKEIIKKLVLKSAGVTVRYRGNVNAGIPYPLEKMKNKLSSLYDAQCDAEQFLSKLDLLEGE